MLEGQRQVPEIGAQRVRAVQPARARIAAVGEDAFEKLAASAGSSTSSGSGAAMPCQPVPRRLVITNRPAGARPSSALTWPGSVTLSSTSHPGWLASQATARSRSASSGSSPASAGYSAAASAARPVSIPAGLSAVTHQIRL